MEIDRAIVIVLDSVGVGEMPDAAGYGDAGSNTLAHTASAVDGISLPNLGRLGLGNIIPIEGVPPDKIPSGCYGKMAERSVGKDSTTGHWEIAGIITNQPFPLYPNGFSSEVILPFEKAIGRRILGNVPASGTEIIKELGEEHMRTGGPIVYTSADSVFQIAAHEDVVPLDELCRWCEIARGILVGTNAVARVIARPFAGAPGEFYRTPHRRDFSISPPDATILDRVKDAGGDVIAIGKIEDIFAGRGITEALHAADNLSATEELVRVTASGRGQLVFANLVDFDMQYGHRNDPQGYAEALESFDLELPRVLSSMRESDILIITADHGCDPTTESTDHSREYVPLLVTGPRLKQGIDLGVRDGFCDVAATVADALRVQAPPCGTSFLSDVT